MPIFGYAPSGTAGLARSVSTAVSLFWPFEDPNYAATVIGIGTIPITPFLMPFAAQFSAVDIFVSNSFSLTNVISAESATVSAFVAIYTNNLSTLSLASSGSVSYAYVVSGSTSSVSYQGLKNLTIPLVANMTPGNYWYAISSSSASGGNIVGGVLSNIVNSFGGAQSAYLGVFGLSTGASMQPVLGYGSYSVTSAAFPAAIGFSEIIGSALGNTAAPIVNFKNYSA